MPIRVRRCVCGREYEILDHGGSMTALSREDIENLSCPDCDGAEFVALVSVGTGIELGDVAGVGRVCPYPYFDRGLHRTITSAAHRRQVCRELGVVPVEGNVGGLVDRELSRQESLAERAEAAYKEQEARDAADPAVRRANAQFAEMMSSVKNPFDLDNVR
jgi:hypothetical protein